MNKLKTGLTTAVIAASLSIAGISPASTTPLVRAEAIRTQTDVVQVRDGWHRGYRGYRNYRPGYRHSNGWWFPAGAFVAGALIGGAIANSNNYYGGGGYYGSYYPRYAEPRYYAPRYYEPGPVYYPPRSSYRQGYRDGYRDGYNGRRYGNIINCTDRLQSAGKC